MVFDTPSAVDYHVSCLFHAWLPAAAYGSYFAHAQQCRAVLPIPVATASCRPPPATSLGTKRGLHSVRRRLHQSHDAPGYLQSFYYFIFIFLCFIVCTYYCCYRDGRAEGLTFDHAMTGHSFDLNISALYAGADETWPNVTMVR